MNSAFIHKSAVPLNPQNVPPVPSGLLMSVMESTSQAPALDACNSKSSKSNRTYKQAMFKLRSVQNLCSKSRELVFTS